MSPYARETSLYDKEPGTLGLGPVSEGPMRSKHPGILEQRCENLEPPQKRQL